MHQRPADSGRGALGVSADQYRIGSCGANWRRCRTRGGKLDRRSSSKLDHTLDDVADSGESQVTFKQPAEQPDRVFSFCVESSVQNEGVAREPNLAGELSERETEMVASPIAEYGAGVSSMARSAR